MQKVKWLFFGYLTLVALVLAGIGASLAFTPGRDANTLYTIYASNIRTLDPAKISDTTSSSVGGQVFECLYNYDYEARPYKLIPALAESMPQVSADGLHVTLKIKKGIHFYDPLKEVFKEGKGREVRASDFVYNWKRIADFHLDTQNYSNMLEGKVQGIDEWRQYTKSTPPEQVDWDLPVKGLEVVDDYTIRIHLIRPDPQLPFNLAHLPMAPVAREAVEFYKDQFKFRPIGTGPYMISQYQPEQRILFEANPVYRGRPDAPGDANLPPEERLPHIKRMQMEYFEEDLPAWAVFEQGLIDVSGIPRDAFATAIDARTRDITPAMQAKGIRLIKAPSPTVWFFGFNMEDPIVGKNRALRQAMSMAFDRQRYIDLMLNGRGVALKGVIPPGFPTYDENAVNPFADFNLDAARAKLKEAERIQGGPIPPLTFLVAGTDTTARQIAEYMQVQMQQIGLTIRADYRTWARFQEMIDGKQAQFYTLGWQADYPDEQTFLQLFYGPNRSPGPNSANYRNPEFDKLYEQASVMLPSPQRDVLYKQMQAIVQVDCPWIINCSSVTYQLFYDWVGNIAANPYVNGGRQFWTLDVSKRQQMLSKR